MLEEGVGSGYPVLSGKVQGQRRELFVDVLGGNNSGVSLKRGAYT